MEFGHAIFESLSCGRPVLISDQTPWQGLFAKQAGIDLPLSDIQQFVEAISYFYHLNQDEDDRFVAGAVTRANTYLNSTDFTAQYDRLFAES